MASSSTSNTLRESIPRKPEGVSVDDLHPLPHAGAEALDNLTRQNTPPGSDERSCCGSDADWESHAGADEHPEAEGYVTLLGDSADWEGEDTVIVDPRDWGGATHEEGWDDSAYHTCSWREGLASPNTNVDCHSSRSYLDGDIGSSKRGWSTALLDSPSQSAHIPRLNKGRAEDSVCAEAYLNLPDQVDASDIVDQSQWTSEARAAWWEGLARHVEESIQLDENGRARETSLSAMSAGTW